VVSAERDAEASHGWLITGTLSMEEATISC
jgi:hypothetical protein